MLERLRQNMRDVNRTVKWVMKKTSQVNERDQGKGKVMLKILQARLQQYVNRELPDVQAGFKKGTHLTC